MAGRSSRAGSIIVVLLLSALAGLAGYFLLQAERSDDEEVVVPPPVGATGFPTSGRDDGGELVEVAADRVTVAATSVLAATGDITYDPENTLDGDLLTAWNSDGAEGGRGEILTYRFDQPIELRVIRFVNGDAKSGELFTSNHRMRVIVLHADAASHEVTLLDTADEQQIEADFGLTSEVRIEVTDIYPGDGFDNPNLIPDLALTEIQFLSG